MRIQFLGVGGFFSGPDQWHSNMLVTASNGKRMLFDCGSDCRHSIKEALPSLNNGNIHEHIDTVYVSHVHGDHCGGLEWLGFATYFNPAARKSITLRMAEETWFELWEDTLSGSMTAISGKDLKAEDYFKIALVLDNNHSFDFNGIRCELVETIHVDGGDSGIGKFNYGLQMMDSASGGSAFISGDTTYDLDSLMPSWLEADIIFQECETSTFKSGVHCNYADLVLLNPDIKKKMWLYHYSPNPSLDAVADGFAGFAVKGQSFEA